MRELGSLRRFACAILLLAALPAAADECAGLLVPDMPLPQLDMATDLAYLAAITPETYARHRANAYPKLSHLEVQLPIARDLLRSAEDFDSFRNKRDQAYVQYAFAYDQGRLRDYFAQLLPLARADAYDACRHSSGLTVRIVRADRDVAQMLVSWHATAGETPTVSLKDFAVTGASLVGAAPVTLGASPVALLFLRNLDVDLRWTATTGSRSSSEWIPRFLPTAPATRPAGATCADADKVTRSLLKHLLERDAKPAELAAQSALLKKHSNSVRQLAERAVLGEEYRRKFVTGKDLEEVIAGLYQRVLGRKGDAKGIASNKVRFRNADFASAALTFFRNAEYDRSFGDWTVPDTTVAYCPAPN